MAVSTTFTYLGKTSEGYHMYEGRYQALTGDLYSRTTRIVLTFTGLAVVSGLMGLSGGLANAAGNAGTPVVMASIATNVVTLMALESAAVGTAPGEKTDAEAYGAAVDLRVTVFGL